MSEIWAVVEDCPDGYYGDGEVHVVRAYPSEELARQAAEIAGLLVRQIEVTEQMPRRETRYLRYVTGMEETVHYLVCAGAPSFRAG